MSELTALPSIGEDRWVPWVRAADALLVNGGDALYLAHWTRQSGLADLAPSLPDTVWVGLSAGSMVASPRIGDDFVGWTSPAGDNALGWVDFSIFPHLDHPALPENTMADAERWAAGIGNPAYAICDDTAIKVEGGAVEVISEGHWKLFSTRDPAHARGVIFQYVGDTPASLWRWSVTAPASWKLDDVLGVVAAGVNRLHVASSWSARSGSRVLPGRTPGDRW